MDGGLLGQRRSLLGTHKNILKKCPVEHQSEGEKRRSFYPNVSYFSDGLVERRRGVRVQEEPLVGAGGDLVLPEEAVVPQLGDPLLKQLSRLHLQEEEEVVVSR